MLELIAYLSGMAVIVATVVLAYENRASNEILKAASVIVGGVTVSLLTMFLFFRNEEITIRFAASAVYKQQTGAPIDLPANLRTLLPDFTETLDHQSERYYAFRHMAALEPDSVRNLLHNKHRADPLHLVSLYNDLVVLQILRTMRHQYALGWSHDFEPEIYSVLGSSTNHVQVSNMPTSSRLGHGARMEWDTISSTFQGNPFVAAEFPFQLELPPATSLVAVSQPRGRHLKIENAFVRIDIDIDAVAALDVPSDNAVAKKLGFGAGGEYAVTLMPVVVHETFKGAKRGHPEMQRYRKWAERLVEALRTTFDDGALWPKLEGIASEKLHVAPERHPASLPIAVPSDLVQRADEYTVVLLFDEDAPHVSPYEIADVVFMLTSAGVNLKSDGPRAGSGRKAFAPLYHLPGTSQNSPTILTLLPDGNDEALTQLERLTRTAFQTYLPAFEKEPAYRTMTFSQVSAQLPDGDLKDAFREGLGKALAVVILDYPPPSASANR